MSAFKGTPAPWAIQMAEDCRGRQLDEMVKWVVTAHENDMWVSTGPTWDPEHDAEALANARLIAAAPDLLEALQIARDFAAYAQAEPADLALIDAAIAKALGEHP